MNERTLQGSLTFLGFVISIMAIAYFAFEYIPQVSPWTQVGSLVLLALMFAFIGVYLKHTVVGEPFFSGPRLRWLRPPVVMYLSAIVSAIFAEGVFLGIDEISRPVKILVSLAIGIGLIIAVATRTKRGEADEART